MSFGQWSGSRWRRGEARFFGRNGWRVSSLSSGDGGGLDPWRQRAQWTGHFPWSRGMAGVASWAGGVGQIPIVCAEGRTVGGDRLDWPLLAGESGEHLSDGVAGQLLGCRVIYEGGRQVPGWGALHTTGLLVLICLRLKFVPGCMEPLVDPYLVG